MALTLDFGCVFVGLFWSFFELIGFGSAGVGFSWEGAAGAVGEFVIHRVFEGGLVAALPLGGVGVQGGQEERVEGRPDAFEAQAAGRQAGLFGGLAAELDDQVAGWPGYTGTIEACSSFRNVSTLRARIVSAFRTTFRLRISTSMSMRRR